MIFNPAFALNICGGILSLWLVCCPGASEAQTLAEGKASYYSDKFEGRKTASGELYRKDSLTAAHRILPFGTKVKVTNLKNNLHTIVRINDRGPHIKGRIIDLSRKAMENLGGINAGVIEVSVEILPKE